MHTLVAGLLVPGATANATTSTTSTSAGVGNENETAQNATDNSTTTTSTTSTSAGVGNVNINEDLTDNQLRGILKAFLEVCQFYKKTKINEDEITRSFQGLANICGTMAIFEKYSLHCMVALQGQYKLYDTYVSYVRNPVEFRSRNRNNQVYLGTYRTREKFLEKFVKNAPM
jgi:hypothetical protein